LYGFHSNETSFVEYGFVDPDASKQICVDELVERLFREAAEDGTEKRNLLETKGYWRFVDPFRLHLLFRIQQRLVALFGTTTSASIV